MACISDPPDYLYEYRQRVFKAKDLVYQLRKEITIPDSMRELNQGQIQSKYTEIMEKLEQLGKALGDYDELLYELKQKVEKYLESDLQFIRNK